MLLSVFVSIFAIMNVLALSLIVSKCWCSKYLTIISNCYPIPSVIGSENDAAVEIVISLCISPQSRKSDN